MKLTHAVLTALCVFFLSVAASAQTAPAPAPTATPTVTTVTIASTITFGASLDHAILFNGKPVVTGYRVDIVLASGGSTALSKDYPKQNGDGASMFTYPMWTSAEYAALAPGTYVANLYVVGPGGSANAGSSNPFTKLAPLPPAPRPSPAAVVVK